MLGVRLDPEMEKRLERLAAKTGRTKSFYVREAIREYVEDREDYELAVAASRNAEPYITLEELMRKYGLDNHLRSKSGKAVRQVRQGNAASNNGLPVPTSRKRA